MKKRKGFNWKVLLVCIVVVYAVRPTAEETATAQMESNKMFKKALLNGAMVRKTLEQELENQGIWNKEKQKKLED
jgi:hypothetical protein